MQADPAIAPVRILGLPFRWSVVALVMVFAVMCAAVFALLLDARSEERAKASAEAGNISAAVTQDIARNIELYDLSIKAVLERIADPAVMAVPNPLRQAILFDRAASAPYLGAILVLDEHGKVLIESLSTTPRSTNYADRDYFQAQAQRADLGLYVGRPVLSKRDSDQLIIGLSRRYNKPDGSFGGVVVGTLRLEYLHNLFARMQMGPRGSLALFRSDGTMIMRQPYEPI